MKHKIPPTLVIVVILSFLGMAGNYLHLPLFFGVDFIFGSIAALLALRLAGLRAGVSVAIVAGAYTYVLWGHPYAMIIFTLEALCVGILMQRRVSSLVLADIIYWTVIGVPLIWLFYRGIMGMPETQSLLILLKQPVNGITNAIIATFLLFLIPGRFYIKRLVVQESRIRLKELLFTILLSISFFVTLALIIYQNQVTRAVYENNLHNQMTLFVDFLEHQIIDENGKLDIEALQKDYHASKYHYDVILLASDKAVKSSLSQNNLQNFLNTGNKKTLPGNNIQLWMPERKGQPFMMWWKQAYYYIEKPLMVPDTSLLLLQNSRSIIDKLQTDATRAFLLLFVLVIVSGLIAYYISNMLTGTIIKLTEATKDIAEKLQSDIPIEWPQSAVNELQQLSVQARLMSVNISETFDDVNKRSSAIIEASVDAIITINQMGTIESFNHAAERLFGYTRDEVIGENVRCLLPEPYQFNHDTYIHDFSSSDRKPFYGSRRELAGLRKNGTSFPIELSLTTVKLQNQVIYNGIISDISERKENERLKREFISTVSHELRTPLTSIQGAIKLIQAQNKNISAEEIQGLIDLADRNSNRLKELINDLLDFEKLDSDGIEYDLQSIELDDLIASIIHNDSPMAELASVKLVHNEYSHCQVNLDPSRLSQVISNFISNAIKFSPENESVLIGCHCEDGYAKIYVRDRGEGIPDEFKGRIFQRFSQADSSDTKRVQRGTGLGLAIAKRIAEDMGGHIGFESPKEGGSIFFVKFPVITP